MKFAGICSPKAIQLESANIQDFVLTLQSRKYRWYFEVYRKILIPRRFFRRLHRNPQRIFA